MRLPRFRVRTLLILVLLAGVGTGSYGLWLRSVAYRLKADSYERMERRNRSLSRFFADWGEAPRGKEGEPPEGGTSAKLEALAAEAGSDSGSGFLDSARSAAASADQYASLKRKYRRAARYPFLPVAPDPPEPE